MSNKDKTSERGSAAGREKPRKPAEEAAHQAETLADIGAVFRGLGGFVEMLGALVEKAEESTERQGEFKIKGLGDQARGVYGFSVRSGLGGIPRVNRFGNLNPGPKGPVVEDVREPLVDVFDEGDEVLVTAELPGVAEDEITLSLVDGHLALKTTGRHLYAKDIALPEGIDPASLSRSHRNGILQVKLRKA